MFPHDLTYGVLDNVVKKQVIPGALVWITAITRSNDGRTFWNVMDGGTKLHSADNSKCRYIMRALVLNPGNKAAEVGDIFRLTSYTCVSNAKDGRPALSIDRMEFVRNAGAPIPHSCKGVYPHVGAIEELDKLEGRQAAQGKQAATAITVQLKSSSAGKQGADAADFRASDSGAVGYSTNANQQNLHPNLHPGVQGSRPSPYDPRSNPYDSTNANQQNVHPNLHPGVQGSRPSPYDPRSNPYDSGAVGYSTNANQHNLHPNLHPGVQGARPSPYDSRSNPYDSYANERQPQNAPTAFDQSSDSYKPFRRGQPTDPPTTASSYAPQYKARPGQPVAHRVDGQFVPIKALTTFMGRWTVRGRFVNVGEPRSYSNPKGDGKIWNVDLMDSREDRGTIRVTMFNKAVDRFQPVIKENQIYTVTKGKIKAANKKFNSGAHEFEMEIGEDAEVQWVAEDDPTVPAKSVQPVVPISSLPNMTKSTMVSVCGVLIKCSDTVEITARSTGRPQNKRDITVVDDSSVSVDVTLWGMKTQLIERLQINPALFPVVQIENVRVDEYNGRRLSSVGQTMISLNPNTPQGQQVHQWFQREGRNRLGSFQSLSTSGWSGFKGEAARLTIEEIMQRVNTMPESELEDKGAWFSCRAHLMKIHGERTFYWVGCPKCGKKVNVDAQDQFGMDSQDGNAGAYCSSCEADVDPVKKYILPVEIADSTGSLSCVAMGDKGTQLMGGLSADALFQLLQSDGMGNQDKVATDFFYDRCNRLYAFRLNAKMERYRDEAKVKYKIFGAEPLSGNELELSNGDVTPDPDLVQAGMTTMRQNILADARNTLEFIYSCIPRVTTRTMNNLN